MRIYTYIKRLLPAAVMLAAALALLSCLGGFADEGTDAPGQKDCLTIWAWDESFNIAAAKTAKEFYLKDHPDASIEIVTIAQDDIVARLNTRLSSGAYEELPDIVLIEDYRIWRYLHTYPNEFADLSSIASPDDFAHYKTEVNQRNGRMYGIPFDCGVAGLFYRTDYIREAGFTKEDMEHLTWERYIEIGKAVREKTGKYMLTLNPGDLGQIRMMLQSAGSWYTNEEGMPDMLQNEALKEAIRTYKKIVDEGIALYIADWGQFVAAFNNGDVATVPTGCWIAPSIEHAADQSGKWAVAELPRMGGISGSVNASSLGGGGWYVLKNAGHEQEAKQFLQETFASNVELMDRLADEIQLVSTLKAAQRAPNYGRGVSFFGGQKIFEDFIRWVELVPTINYGEDTYEMEENMAEALQKIIDGVDMEVVLESTFAAAKTAASESGEQ